MACLIILRHRQSWRDKRSMAEVDERGNAGGVRAAWHFYARNDAGDALHGNFIGTLMCRIFALSAWLA
jgi:hypothetical protein